MENIYKLADQFAELATADIADTQNSRGIMRSDILPYHHSMKFAGVAVTVQCVPGDNITINKAMAMAKSGSVLVVDCGGDDSRAMFGDLFTSMCMKRGIRAAVVDGYCRDKQSIIESGFPVFCKGVNLNRPEIEHCGEVNKKIFCGGVEVEPGDIIVGDADGVVVVKQQEAEDILKKAQTFFAQVEEKREKCMNGMTTIEVMGILEKVGMTQEELDALKNNY